MIENEYKSMNELIDENKQLKDKLSKIEELDWSKVIRFTGTTTGDLHEVHNDILRKFTKITGDES